MGFTPPPSHFYTFRHSSSNSNADPSSVPPFASQAARPDGTRKSTSTRLKNPAQSIYQILFPGARGDFEFFGTLTCGALLDPGTYDLRLRAVGILTPCLFPIPCTTLSLPLPVHGLDLPPLLHRFAAKSHTFAATSISIWRQIAPVSARHLRRVHTAPTPCPHGTHTVSARHPHRVRMVPTPFPPLSPAGCQRTSIIVPLNET